MNEPINIISDAIEHYKILNRVITSEKPVYQKDNKNYKKLIQVYYEIGGILSDPDILNDHEKLAELDKYHIELYESNEQTFRSRRVWMSPYYFS